MIYTLFIIPYYKRMVCLIFHLLETFCNNVTFKVLCKFDLIVLTFRYTVVQNYQNFVYMLYSLWNQNFFEQMP